MDELVKSTSSLTFSTFEHAFWIGQSTLWHSLIVATSVGTGVSGCGPGSDDQRKRQRVWSRWKACGVEGKRVVLARMMAVNRGSSSGGSLLVTNDDRSLAGGTWTSLC